MGSNGGNVQVTDATVELDDLKGAGGIVVAFAVPLSVITHVELGTLDLDFYLPAGPTPAAEASPVASVTPILALLGPVDRPQAQGRPHRAPRRGDHRRRPRRRARRRHLRMNEVRVADVAGARIAVRGAVASYWTARPRADFAFDLDAPDMDRVLELAGGAPAGLGALRLRGGVAGSWESLALRDCALDAMGWSVRASGTLALPGAAEGTIKSASYKGRIVVNGQPIEAAIDYDLSGHKPVIAADLRTDRLDFGRLGGAGAANQPRPPRGPRRPRGPADRHAVARGRRHVRVAVASLGGGPMPLGDAEITATLKDGILTVSRFRGGLDGGTISLAGVVDGSQPSLSFDLKGELSGVNLAEMLRDDLGSNEIGSLIRIVIDGRVGASDLALRGAGTTVAVIRSSLAGGAQLDGHVQARADRFLSRRDRPRPARSAASSTSRWATS